MLKPLILASLFLPMMALADVKELQPGEEAACQLVVQETCKTTSREPAVACLEWHLETAEEEGADALVIRGSDERTQRLPSLSGGTRTVVNTRVKADYYNCGYAKQELMEAAKEAAQQVEKIAPVVTKSAEERLLQLNSLKEKGLITQDEYDQKRQEILSEL